MTSSYPTAESADQALMQLLQQRHSCRAFLSRQVPRPNIRRIVEMAQRTASWCNSQPWQNIVTSGQATEQFRSALYAYAQTQAIAVGKDPPAADIPFPRSYEGVYRERQREAGWALYRSVGIAHGDRAASGRQMLENFRLFGAPHFMLVTTARDLGVYGAIDCGGYIANFLLAAESLGLAAVSQAAIATCAPFVRKYFGVPDSRMIVCGISFGFPDKAHPANSFRTVRAKIDDVITFLE